MLIFRELWHIQALFFILVDYCLKDLPQNPEVLDVGGGPLTYSIAFARRGNIYTPAGILCKIILKGGI